MDTNEKSVADNLRETADALGGRVYDCRNKLRKIGLGELMPPIPGNSLLSAAEHIVCDPKGNAIVHHGRWSRHVAEAFNEVTKRNVESFCMNGDRDPVNEPVNVFTSIRTLTLPERHTLSAMAKYFESYYPGFKADDGYVSLPEAMQPYAAPAEYEDEADAFEAAEVLAELTGLESDVIKTDNGYAAVLNDKLGDLTNWTALRVIGASMVLEHYRCIRKDKGRHEIEEDDNPSPWQRRITERYTQQRRIKDGINAILAHLGHSGAEGRESASPRLGRGLDALIPPASKPSGKEKKAKASA